MHYSIAVKTYVLKLSCPDQPGVVASIAQGLLELGANIIANSEFREPQTNTFCMRSVFETTIETPQKVSDALLQRSASLQAHLSIRDRSVPRKALLMVSKYDHCMIDLFYRIHSGELSLEIPIVVSNHNDLHDLAVAHDAQFKHIEVSADAKQKAEQQVAELIDTHAIDFIVLARYMQILSPAFCDAHAGSIINIHHSFLPSFKGADPYQQAWDRGVKLIGATAHYVTPELDEGPIITQDVAAVTHRETRNELATKGRDVERRVLSRAVKAHAEDRIFLLDHKTVVFD